MRIELALAVVLSLAVCSYVAALDPSCELKHSESFAYPAYGVKFVQIKSSFSSQDAVIVKQTDSQEITVDVNLYTDGNLDGTPLQLNNNQIGSLLVLEAKVNPASTTPSPSSPSSHVSGASGLQTFSSALVLGLFLQFLSSHKYAVVVASVFGLVSLSMENCSPQARFTVTIPRGVQSVCLNDQCLTYATAANLGVAAHFISPTDRELNMVTDAFSVVRRDLPWSSVEPALQTYDFSQFEALQQTLLSTNTTPYWILDYKNVFYDNGTSPISENAIAGFVNYTMKSLQLLSGNDSVWEMYNEPNIGFWKPNPNVTQYINLALAVGRALKGNFPKEYHIGPALASPGLYDWSFIESCFESGLLEYWDGVSVHPYRWVNPENVLNDFYKLNLLIQRYKPANKPIVPIIAGEWGYPSNLVTERQQAMYLPRMFLTNMATEVVMSIWYDWRNDGSDPTDNEHNFGTVYNPYLPTGEYPFNPKPSYFAARTLKSVISGYRFNKRIRTDSPSVWIVLLNNEANDFVLAVWSTLTNQIETVSLPVSPGSFRIISYLGNSTSDVTVNSGQALTIGATEEVQYIVPLTTNPYLQLIASVSKPPLIITEKLEDFVLFFTNPLKEDVTLDYYEQTGIVVAPGQTVALWHHVEVLLDTQAFDLPIFVNFTSFGPLRMQSHVASLFSVVPVVYPTTINGSIPASVQTSIDLSARLDVVVNDQSSSFDVTTVSRASLIVLVNGHISSDQTTPVGFVLSSGTTSLYNGSPLLVSQFADFSTFSATLKQTFTTSLGGNTSVAASVDFSLAKPATMPLGFDSYGIIALNYTSEYGYRYYTFDVKVPQPIAGTPTQFGQWVYGDGSGIRAGIRVQDSAGETFQMLVTMNWIGWRYVVYRIEDHGNWGGNGGITGVPDYPLRWVSLFVSNNPTSSYTQYQGRLYISTIVAYSH